jgi:hypothetical protein
VWSMSRSDTRTAHDVLSALVGLRRREVRKMSNPADKTTKVQWNVNLSTRRSKSRWRPCNG